MQKLRAKTVAPVWESQREQRKFFLPSVVHISSTRTMLDKKLIRLFPNSALELQGRKGLLGILGLRKASLLTDSFSRIHTARDSVPWSQKFFYLSVSNELEHSLSPLRDLSPFEKKKEKPLGPGGSIYELAGWKITWPSGAFGDQLLPGLCLVKTGQLHHFYGGSNKKKFWATTSLIPRGRSQSHSFPLPTKITRNA